MDRLFVNDRDFGRGRPDGDDLDEFESDTDAPPRPLKRRGYVSDESEYESEYEPEKPSSNLPSWAMFRRPLAFKSPPSITSNTYVDKPLPKNKRQKIKPHMNPFFRVDGENGEVRLAETVRTEVKKVPRTKKSATGRKLERAPPRKKIAGASNNIQATSSATNDLGYSFLHPPPSSAQPESLGKPFSASTRATTQAARSSAYHPLDDTFMSKLLGGPDHPRSYGGNYAKAASGPQPVSQASIRPLKLEGTSPYVLGKEEERHSTEMAKGMDLTTRAESASSEQKVKSPQPSLGHSNSIFEVHHVPPFDPEKSASKKSSQQRSKTRDQIIPARDDANSIGKIIDWLRALFNDDLGYKNLLGLKQFPNTAQYLVDNMQEILDSPEIQDLEFRRNVIVTLQKFAGSEIYPSSYQIEETFALDHYMGSGGFGEIYKSKLRGQVVCIKAIRLPDMSFGSKFAKQFLKEAILWAQLRHQNIVPFLGFCHYRQRPCLVSPWMDYGHINSYLVNNPSVNRYLLVKDIASGLGYLHSWKIVHGDLKGANVLVDEHGHALLTDFGISSIFDAAIPHWTSQSTVASKGGSIRWQAPELLDSNDDQDVYNTMASDVYAWGCTCYEVFTGKIPFWELARDATVMIRVTRDKIQPTRPPPADPVWLTYDLKPGFWDNMAQCWLGDPTKRPSVGALLVMPQLVGIPDHRPTQDDLYRQSLQYRATRRKRDSSTNLREISNLLGVT